MERLRIGVLGAARIAPAAMMRPARAVPEVTVAAIAARDAARAERFARRHGVPAVYPDYATLLADPDIDAVYIPLPNSLHAPWTMRALAAGKHVLCEKPLTANADEAAEVARAAERAGLVVMEAFHYRYHPLARRMREIVEDGELGEIRHIDSSMCFPLPLPGDIRFRRDLAGGSLMDAGCYAVHAVRLLAPPAPPAGTGGAAGRAPGTAPGKEGKGGEGGEEIEVLDATATTTRRDHDVDRAMVARLRLPGGASATVRSSLLSRRVLDLGVRVEGTRGVMRVFNHVMPQLPHRFEVTVRGRRRREHLGEAGRTPTYTLQLQAFADAVLHGAVPLTPASDSVTTMRIIDDIYRKAGMTPRGS